MGESNVKDHQSVTEKNIKEVIETKLYSRRWLILFLYIMFAAVNNMQWIEYSIIEHIMSRYYEVSSLLIEWTAMIFSAFYVVLLVPVSYIMCRGHLRNVCVVGVVLTCLGSWIKVISVAPDRFAVAFVGQTLVASCQTIIMTVPPNLAAAWFGTDEIAMATALGTAAVPLGVSASSVLVPLLIQNHENLDDVGSDISGLLWGIAILCTCVMAVNIIFFKNEPEVCPSEAKAIQKLYQHEQPFLFWKSLGTIIKNKNFLLLLNSHGINIGTLNTITVIVNPLCLAHFKNGEQVTGTITLIMGVTGLLMSPIFGKILDKTKKFKAMSVFLYVSCLIAEVLFAGALYFELEWAAYVTSGLLGLTMMSFTTIGYEVCAEITYPEPEGVSIAILNAANQIYGIILVTIINRSIEAYGDMAAHTCLFVVLLIGTILTIVMKPETKRLEASRIVCKVGY